MPTFVSLLKSLQSMLLIIRFTGDNALRAVAASRPDMSRDIVSEPQRSTVRESGDTYCDLTGVKTDLTSAGMSIFAVLVVFS